MSVLPTRAKAVTILFQAWPRATQVWKQWTGYCLSLSWNLIWVHRGWKLLRFLQLSQRLVQKAPYVGSNIWEPVIGILEPRRQVRREWVTQQKPFTVLSPRQSVTLAGTNETCGCQYQAGPEPQPKCLPEPLRDRWLHVSLWHREPLAGPLCPNIARLQTSWLTPPLNHVLLPGGARVCFLSLRGYPGVGGHIWGGKGLVAGSLLPQPTAHPKMFAAQCQDRGDHFATF